MISTGIHLTELISDAISSREIFSDSVFSRQISHREFGVFIKATIRSDRLRQYGCCIHYISLDCMAPQRIILELDGTLQPLATGWWINGTNVKHGWWFPRKPVVRVYDRLERILEEIPVRIEDFTPGGRTFVMVPESPCTIEFPLVEWIDPGKTINELSSFEPVERLPMSKCRWYRYRSPGDFWDFIIRGQIYKTRHETTRLSGVCQQMALTLYLHLRYLSENTGKQVYTALSDWTVYSVMLSLPSDGFWRHPDTSDRDETHTRFQLDGILLLLEAYRKTSDPRMLDAAGRAMNAVLSLAQKIESGGRWFIHDTYEKSVETVRLNYPDFLNSQAFGKPLANTMCLNTHIWTLVTILHFRKVLSSSVYDEALRDGLLSLQHVLESRPATWRYTTIYGIRDQLIRWSLTGGKQMRILRAFYDRWLEMYLRRLKIRHPRLLMPNGYIERDLCVSCLSDGYHFVTVRDLYVLYRQSRLPWLAAIVQRCTVQSLRNRWAEHALRYDPRALFFLDILSLHADCWGVDIQMELQRMATVCRDLGFGISSDWLTHPLIPRLSLDLPAIWLSATEKGVNK